MELISPSIERHLSVGTEDHNLPLLATITGVTVTDDGSGGTTTETETIAENVPVRIAPVGRGTTERIEAAGYNALETVLLEFALGTTIAESHTVVIDSRSFEVVAVLGDYSYDAVLQVVAVER